MQRRTLRALADTLSRPEPWGPAGPAFSLWRLGAGRTLSTPAVAPQVGSLPELLGAMQAAVAARRPRDALALLRQSDARVLAPAARSDPKAAAAA